MTEASEADRLFDVLELTEYEATALRSLLRLGRTTAPDLSEATRIPKARIYGVLESLAEAGYVKIIPERPKLYQAKPPAELLDRAIENRRQDFAQFEQRIDSIRTAFLSEFEPIYEQATEEVTPTEELFYVVDVGAPSERETRTLYETATEGIYVITKSFEYFNSIRPAVDDALARDITMRVLFLHPDHLSATNQDTQRRIISELSTSYPEIGYRFSHDLLPLRGTLVDPSMEYASGKAIFLVEEKDIPLHLRQAAVTENASLVAAMYRYFSLIWDYDSTTDPPGAS